MRIAIIGAGASGLTTYLFLVKNLPQPPAPATKHEYVIYESHTISDRKKSRGSYELPLVGSGLGIAPNGMRVLFDLDSSLHDDVQARGFPADHIQFNSSRGWKLGVSHTAHSYEDHTEAMVMISREDVLDCLFDRVPEGIVVHSTVSEVVDGDDQKKPIVKFKDGSIETFDLVIGADGVRSKARDAFLESRYSASYTGLFGIGGSVPTSLLEPPSAAGGDATAAAHVGMTFGATGFFGYAPCTTRPSSVSETKLNGGDPVRAGDRSFWWSSFDRDDPDTRSLDKEDLRKKLVERHGDWKDPAIQRIVNAPELDFIGVATWVMPKAPTWAGNRVVLVGDAAHALPSSSGQGISQAMLDSQALSLLFAHHLKAAYVKKEPAEADALKVSLRQYVEMRKPPVEQILDVANRMGEQKKSAGFVQEMLRLGILKVIFTFFPDMLNKQVMAYDVKQEVERVIGKDTR